MRSSTTVRLLLRWLFSLFMFAGTALLFIELAENIWFKEGFEWDAPLMLDIHRYSVPWLDRVMELITLTGGQGAVVLAGGSALWRWHWRQQRFEALTLVIMVAGSVILNTLLKQWFARPRPDVFHL